MKSRKLVSGLGGLSRASISMKNINLLLTKNSQESLRQSLEGSNGEKTNVSKMCFEAEAFNDFLTVDNRSKFY